MRHWRSSVISQLRPWRRRWFYCCACRFPRAATGFRCRSSMPICLSRCIWLEARRRDVRYGDLVYREHRIVLEYQSSEFHELTGTDEEDEDRRDDIEAAGYRVMFITPSRIRDFDRFEAVALRLAHHLGVTLPDATLGRTEKRIELRRGSASKILVAYCIGVSAGI